MTFYCIYAIKQKAANPPKSGVASGLLLCLNQRISYLSIWHATSCRKKVYNAANTQSLTPGPCVEKVQQ